MQEFDFTALSPHVRYNLIIGLVTPRPIALITSLDAAGRLNAAPFSAFNYACVDPVLVTIGAGNRPGVKDPVSGLPVPKDTAQNIRVRGEFVINVVDEQIAEAMNVCAIDFPQGEDELKQAGLTTAGSSKIQVPRIAEAPASLECREVVTIERGNSRLIVGEVLCAHVREDLVDPAGPYIRAEQIHTVGRMNGAGNYVRTRDAIFQMPRIPYAEWKGGGGKG
jgi:flavin reductase (DIM6/NTAB) family NADH-FMN oxidoreductase RutF